LRNGKLKKELLMKKVDNVANQIKNHKLQLVQASLSLDSSDDEDDDRETNNNNSNNNNGGSDINDSVNGMGVAETTANVSQLKHLF
jgi:hypothetical protein